MEYNGVAYKLSHEHNNGSTGLHWVMQGLHETPQKAIDYANEHYPKDIQWWIEKVTYSIKAERIN